MTAVDGRTRETEKRKRNRRAVINGGCYGQVGEL